MVKVIGFLGFMGWKDLLSLNFTIGYETALSLIFPLTQRLFVSRFQFFKDFSISADLLRGLG